MNLRLVVAIITSLLDEVIIVVLLLWVLPRFGITLPIPALIAIGILWLFFSTVLYVSGIRIFRKKPLGGMTNMIGFRGKTITDLNPEGMVRIKGERWEARTSGEHIFSGEEVIVTEQTGLKLIVRKT